MEKVEVERLIDKAKRGDLDDRELETDIYKDIKKDDKKSKK